MGKRRGSLELYPQLAPMVENIDLVYDWRPGRFKIGNCRHGVARRHITCGIVVETNDENAGMTAMSRLNPFVQIQKIVMIARHEDQRVAYGVQEMLCIHCSS